jgi:hypothetical protein
MSAICGPVSSFCDFSGKFFDFKEKTKKAGADIRVNSFFLECG